MVFKAVIFDIDGTLLDTLKDLADSANRVMARLGFPQHELEAYKYFVGDGVGSLAARMLPENSRDQTMVDRVVEEMNKEYHQHWADTTRPYKGIPDLLQALTIRGIKMAVLSNKPDNSAKLTVSGLLPDWHFELILGVSPSVPRKPDPSGALEIANHISIKPNEFIFLGDTNADMLTAVAADMYGVGALWGFRTADELLASGAKLLISNPLDLLKIL